MYFQVLLFLFYKVTERQHRDNTYDKQKHTYKKMLEAMRKSFKRSEEYLDLETYTENQETVQKDAAQLAIQNATPEQVGAVLEALERLKAGKTPMVSA